MKNPGLKTTKIRKFKFTLDMLMTFSVYLTTNTKLDNSSNVCVTSVFHKKNFTGLLTNFFSFMPLNYKTGLIHTLIHDIQN